jgi:hypothetical protein
MIGNLLPPHMTKSIGRDQRPHALPSVLATVFVL